jgi:hypothetical protein
MPIPMIFGIAFLLASLFGYVGYRLGGGTRTTISLAVVGAVAAFLVMRLLRIF